MSKIIDLELKLIDNTKYLDSCVCSIERSKLLETRAEMFSALLKLTQKIKKNNNVTYGMPTNNRRK